MNLGVWLNVSTSSSSSSTGAGGKVMPRQMSVALSYDRVDEERYEYYR